MADLKITQKKSPIGCPQGQRRTLRALGLRRIGQTVSRVDNPSVRGMINSVRHLVEVEEAK